MLQQPGRRHDRAKTTRSERSPSSFEQALAEHFDGALLQAHYVAESADALTRLGFTGDNTLACVAVCRDEVAAPLVSEVERRWGVPFSLVSLAGMMTAGRTGFGAALAHAPIERGRRRLVCYAMPHIAISAGGVIGEVERPGVPAPSHACGALSGLRQSLGGSRASSVFDRLDAEQTLLGERLTPTIGRGVVPDLVELVELAAQAIEEDLWEIFRGTVDDRAADPPVDWALLTGVQVHGPGGVDHVQPRSGYVRVGGALHVVDPTPRPAPDPGRLRQRGARRWLARGAAATTAVVLLNARQDANRS